MQLEQFTAWDPWARSFVACQWREGSTARGRTDGYCHTLQCRPERCAVRLLRESIDEGQLHAWKHWRRKLPYYRASVTATHCGCSYVSLLHAKYSSICWALWMSQYTQGSPYINDGNQVSQWVIWWDHWSRNSGEDYCRVQQCTCLNTSYLLFSSPQDFMPVFSAGSCLWGV